MIEKLYDIVIKNDNKLYVENIDLFNDFYNKIRDFLSYIDKDNRIMEIIKYMLINDDNFDINIINDLIIKFKEINVCNNLLNKDRINILINNLNNYNSIKEIISINRYINNLNNESLCIIKDFINSNIDIEILNIFINNLSNNFLSFDKDDILLMINTIENYNYDNMILYDNNGDDNDIICEFIDNYSYNYLEIKNMCTNLELKDDKLLNYLFYKNKIDTDLYYLLVLNRIGNDNLLRFFNNDLRNYKDLVDNNQYIDDKSKLLITVFNKYFNRDEYKNLINVYNFDKKGERDKLIDFILNDNPLLLSDDLIKYILVNNLENKYFLLNLNECKDKLYINDDTLSLINYKLKKFGFNINKISLLNNMDISVNVCSKLICNCLKTNDISEDKLMLYIKKFIKALLKIYRIDDINVIFGSHNKKSGYYNEETNTIFINIHRIKNIINDDKIYFNIFLTIFHEIRHVIQINDINNGVSNYLEDYILINRSKRYYKDNYKTNDLEIDANNYAINSLFQFVEDYLIEYYDKIVEKYKNKFLVNNKKIVFNCLENEKNQIFNLLYDLNSGILLNHINENMIRIKKNQTT